MKEKRKHTFRLDELAKTNIFTVPEGYFHALHTRIKSRLLENRPYLKGNVFQVPEGYFEALKEKIGHKTIQASLLSDVRLRSNVFQAPSDYFDKLQKEIKGQTTPITPVHQVPEGYFEDLNNKIQAKIKREPTVIHVDFRPSKEWKMAIAACLAVATVGISLFFLARYTTSLPSEANNAQKAVAEQLLANLNKKEIQQYLEKQEHLDSQELVEFSSEKKKQKIQDDFEKDLLPIKLDEKEVLEVELNEMDLSELDADI